MNLFEHHLYQTLCQLFVLRKVSCKLDVKVYKSIFYEGACLLDYAFINIYVGLCQGHVSVMYPFEHQPTTAVLPEMLYQRDRKILIKSKIFRYVSVVMKVKAGDTYRFTHHT